jgi:hypothetical protein
MKTCMEIYRDCIQSYGDGDTYFSVYGYSPILESFGTIALRVDDNDYQGDSRVLYQAGETFGLLIFGWGSCSGCDALQACESPEEVDGLIQRLNDQVRWLPRAEMLAYFEAHDWEGDYCWHSEETREFVEKALALLKGGAQ